MRGSKNRPTGNNIFRFANQKNEGVKNQIAMIELSKIKREFLYKKYSDRLEIDPKLDRKLVSFQANKKEYFQLCRYADLRRDARCKII